MEILLIIIALLFLPSFLVKEKELYLYPQDGSWNKNFNTGKGEYPSLGGDYTGNEPILVKIISNPVKILIYDTYLGKIVKYFRIIEYNGIKYRYYNDFISDLSQSRYY